MEDGRWIWKSRVDEPGTTVNLDQQSFQTYYTCSKCGTLIQGPPVYRVQHKMLILKGWDWLWKSEDNLFWIAVKRLNMVFHEKCFDYQWLLRHYEVWWIP